MTQAVPHSDRFVRRDDSTRVCRRELWEFMLALGSAFGWRQLGTSYRATSNKQAVSARMHDYIPGSSSDSKRITESDARGWATALQLALGSAHLDNMLAAHRGAEPNAAPGGAHPDDVAMRRDIEAFVSMLWQGPLHFALNESGNSLVIHPVSRNNVVQLRVVK